MMRWMLLSLALLATPAVAEDKLRDLCPDRPGLDTPACTVDQGHLQVEIGLADWQLDKQIDSRTDTLSFGDIALRYGVTNSTELRVEWTPYTHVRSRDRASGEIDRVSGIGDVTIGVKQNLHNPDGGGLSVALLPYATLPTGRDEIGAGDWGAGLLIPVSYQLSETVSLALTPEFDAAVNGSGTGRHFAYGSAAGVQIKLSKTVSLSAELQAIRDRDPDEHTTQALAGLSLAWQAGDNLQFDIGGTAGLNRNTPDAEVYVGIARRF